MSDHSAIEWTGATWNPVTGCSKVSPGCAHCYIERTPPMRTKHRRFVNGTTGVLLHPERLVAAKVRKLKPLDRPIFVCSMADLFHDDVPLEYILDVFDVMGHCPERTFQVLTKRPERMRDFMLALPLGNRGPIGFDGRVTIRARLMGIAESLPNVHLGVSIENARYTWRADVLREIPAAVRFISAEPLLGSLFKAPSASGHDDARAARRLARPASDAEGLTLTEALAPRGVAPLDLTGIDWVIVGGESGPGARGMDLAWAREIVSACRAAGVAPFVKQLGARPYEHLRPDLPALKFACEIRDRKGGDIDEWPADLKIRELPGGRS